MWTAPHTKLKCIFKMKLFTKCYGFKETTNYKYIMNQTKLKQKSNKLIFSTDFGVRWQTIECYQSLHLLGFGLNSGLVLECSQSV